MCFIATIIFGVMVLFIGFLFLIYLIIMSLWPTSSVWPTHISSEDMWSIVIIAIYLACDGLIIALLYKSATERERKELRLYVQQRLCRRQRGLHTQDTGDVLTIEPIEVS